VLNNERESLSFEINSILDNVTVIGSQISVAITFL